MNTGQMLLTISGLVLLSTLVLRMNSTISDTDIELGRTKFDLMAVSVATTYMEEIKQKAFDEKTNGSAIGNETNLSTTLGKDNGEARSKLTGIENQNFNDVDDFNNDSAYVFVSEVDSLKYIVKCKVSYFDPSTMAATTSKKFHKKITVTVTSNSLTDPVELSSVFSYWRFR